MKSPLDSKPLKIFIEIIQKLSICTMVLMTVINWIVLISFTIELRFLQAADITFEPAESAYLNNGMSFTVDTLGLYVLWWAVIATAFTMLLLVFKRRQKEQRPHILTPLVISSFCLASVALSQIAIRAFTERLPY